MERMAEKSKPAQKNSRASRSIDRLSIVSGLEGRIFSLTLEYVLSSDSRTNAFLNLLAQSDRHLFLDYIARRHPMDTGVGVLHKDKRALGAKKANAAVKKTTAKSIDSFRAGRRLVR